MSAPITLDPQDIEDTISDAIGDSMGPGWAYSDGAKSIMRAFEREGWSVIQNGASNAAPDTSGDIASDLLEALKECVALMHADNPADGWADAIAAARAALAKATAQAENRITPDYAGTRIADDVWAIGSWLSAALDDPKVCEAMKADIREWFGGGGYVCARPTGVRLEGRMDGPSPMMRVIIERSDGTEAEIIQDNGTIISHWARIP